MKITFYVFLSLKHYIDIVIDYMHNICYIQIALVGYLSSVSATSATVQMLLPPNQTNPTNEVWEKAFSMWKQITTQTSKPEVPIY